MPILPARTLHRTKEEELDVRNGEKIAREKTWNEMELDWFALGMAAFWHSQATPMHSHQKNPMVHHPTLASVPLAERKQAEARHSSTYHLCSFSSLHASSLSTSPSHMQRKESRDLSVGGFAFFLSVQYRKSTVFR